MARSCFRCRLHSAMPLVTDLLNLRLEEMPIVNSIWAGLQVSHLRRDAAGGLSFDPRELVERVRQEFGELGEHGGFLEGTVGIFPPTIEAASAQVDPSQVHRSRNLYAEMSARAIEEIQAQEDAEIFRALEGVDLHYPAPRYPDRSLLDVSLVEHPTDPRATLGWQMHEEVGHTIVNPRAVQAQGVQFPEFEMFSNPTIRIDEVRQRRFDLIERSGTGHLWAQEPILAAILRAKARPPIIPPPPPREATRTVWEALLELDLVDAELGSESRH